MGFVDDHHLVFQQQEVLRGRESYTKVPPSSPQPQALNHVTNPQTASTPSAAPRGAWEKQQGILQEPGCYGMLQALFILSFLSALPCFLLTVPIYPRLALNYMTKMTLNFLFS